MSAQLSIRQRIALCAFVSALWDISSHAATLDTVIFGNSADAASSEQTHGLVANLSETINGQLSQPARRLLPKNPVEINGGDLTFTMSVDPVRRNYFSLKLWGGDDTDDDLGRLYLYVPLNGVNYQVGYRHEGDYLPLSVAAGKPPLPGRFFYSTTLLPLWMTQGKTSLTVRLVSTGRLYGLGSGYEGSGGNYQFNMKMPSRGIYRAYTHNEPMLDVSGETQGVAPAVTTRPAVTDSSILGPTGTYTTGLNAWVTDRLNGAVTSFNTIFVELLAKAYRTPEVTAAYNQPAVLDKIVAVIDSFAQAYYAQPALAFTKAKYLTADGFPADYTVDGGNEVWGGRFGPLGRAIALLKEPLAGYLDITVNYGAGGSKTRRQAWADMLRASLDYGRFNRRTITNQTILGDAHIYKANMGLAALGDPRALSETEAQRYLQEACGLLPWRGNDLPSGGSALRYGSTYYQVTPKGMTREWGYVGSYGEMARHVATFFELTGNADFLAQSVKMSKARAPFRRPAIEVSGSNYYRSMERTGLLAWRAVRETDGEFANEINYVEPAAWSGGMRVAALSQDPTMTGHAKQMLADNQYLNALVSDSRFYRSLTGDALWAFDAFSDYAAVKAAADSGARLPMTDGQADFVWADENGGVIALKRGSERLWVAPYWQAKTGTGINGVARFHYSTTNYDQYGVLETAPRFRASAYFMRPNYVDKPESVGFVPTDDPVNAYAGEVIPLGFVPADAQDGAPFIGRADFYSFRFGRYLFGMNATTNTTQTLTTPAGFTSAADLVSGTSKSGPVTVGPTNSVVLYLNTATDPAPMPSAPLLLRASGNSSPAVVLNWSASSGAEAYKVKKSTTAGGPYTVLKDADGSDMLITETTWTDTNVTAGTPYYYVVSSANNNGESENSMEAAVSAGIGAPWTASDIGSVTLPGNTSIIDDTFTLTGSGSDVGGTADSGHFVSIPWTGDGALIARLSTRAQGGNLNDKMGLLIREDTASGSRNFSLHFDGGSIPDKAKVSYRSSANGTTSVLFGPQVALPEWMKVERSANTYIGSISVDGSSWTEVGRATFTMNATLRFGMFVCSRDAAAVNVSTFDGVTAPGGWGVAPETPQGLSAVAGPGSASLSWSPVPGAMEYLVQRSPTAGGPYGQVAVVSSTSFTDGNLANDTTYYYVVSARNLNGTSASSTEVEVRPQVAPPPIPSGLSALAGNGYVQLEWSPSFQATSYKVKRGTSSSGPYSFVAEVTNASGFRDTSVVNGTTYFYVVTSVGLGGESGNSIVVSAQPSAVPPAPVGLQTIAGNGSVILMWPQSLGATGYNVKRATSPAGPFTTLRSGLAATGYTDTGLSNGTTYYYVVSAVNATGESTNSDAVSGTPSATVMPAPYTRLDIGAVGIAGAASFNGGTYTMVASGADIWNSADGFGFVYVPVNGDCTVTVRVDTLQNTHASAKAGVMIRESLAEGSKFAMAAMTPLNGMVFQYRGTPDDSARQATAFSRSLPNWVRLVRVGNTINAFISWNGSRWSGVGSTTVAMTSRVFVGLALTSHDNSRTASGTFSNFTVLSSGTLAAPTGLSVSASSSSITLSWSALTGATSYNILRATSLDGAYTTIATGVTGTTYTDSTFASGITYYYRISATGSSGEGWPSAAVAATAKYWVPANLSALGGNGQVLLTWSTVADTDGYRIWRATSAGGSFTSVGTSTLSSFTDSTVSNGTKYFYKVTAMRGGAESDASSQASATPQNASTGLAGTWANVSLTTNSSRYNLTTTSSNTSLVVTDASGNPHAIGVGEIVSPINAVAGFGTRFSYWVVATGSNTLSVSDTPGGTAIKATATTTNTNALRGSQRWSAGANWVDGIIPSGVDAVAAFPNNSLPLDVGAVLVDMDLVLGKLVYSNSANFSDCTLVSAVVGTNTNSLRFAVSGTNTSLMMPMIEVPAASQKRLELGTVASGGPALRVAGSQGLMIRASAGGGVTNGIGSNPLKDLTIQNVDWSGFSGGLIVDRGSLFPAYVDRLPKQDLTLGTAYSVSSNALAGLKMGAGQTIAALNGNAMGRIYGLGVLTIGTNNTGGDFGGIVGQEFNGVRSSNSIVKIGTNRQVISGAMVGNGSLDVAEGTLVFAGSGTNTFSGAVTVINGAALYFNSTHAPVSPYASATLTGTLSSANFVSSVAMKNDDTVRVTAAAAGLTLGAEYYVVLTPTPSTNIQIATTKGGPSFVATATAIATVQYSSTTNAISGIYTIASGGTLGGNGRIAPRDTVGGSSPAISVSGQLAPGPEGTHTFGTLILDGANSVRSLLKLEPSAKFTFQVGATNSDRLVFTNTQAGDVIFASNTINFIDDSDGSLPMQTVILTSDSTHAFSGIATNTNGLITNGLAIGSGLSAYPQAALYLRTNNIVLRLAPIPPPAPAFLTANATNNQVELNWSPASGAQTYSVDRAPSPDGLFETVATGIVFSTFTDTNFIPGTTYYYRVRSVANNLESDDFASAFANTSIPAKQSWRIMYFNTAEETDITADSADPDHDGLVNLMEYALGRDPTHAERTPPLGMAISTNGPRLTITFNRTNDPALVYTVFGTDSLVGTNIWTNPVWTSTGSNNTAGPVTVPDTATTTEKSQRFLRLNVR